MGSMLAIVSCGDDATAPSVSSSSSSSTGVEASGTQADTTGTPPPMLEAPYGPCAGPMASTECVDAGLSVAQCLQREADGTPYSACAVVCQLDADCPPVGAGNVTPECIGAVDGMPGLCLLDCNLGVNSCAMGTICIDGDPPTCMWPEQTAGHPDADSFCTTACGPCGATLLLPWAGDCVAECLDDLADCSPEQTDEIFACTGGVACPVGGAAVADCLLPIACIDGSSSTGS